jgi:hypothetical protein
VRVFAELAALAPAFQDETVVAGPPHHLAFVSPEQRVIAGECSARAVVELRDAFENPAPPASPLGVSLTFSPSAGFALFSDEACASAAGALSLAPGGAALAFSFTGTKAGEATLQASAASVAGAQQPVAVDPGPPAQLAFALIASPQREGRPFAVSLEARDAWDNPTPSFAEPAALSLSPTGGDARCASGCLDPATTAPFRSGAWSGTVEVEPLGTWRLVANAGKVSGLSGAFEVVGDVLGPRARLEALNPVIHNSRTVSFDASGSTDPGFPSASLQVSWDLRGTAPAPPPWTPWSSVQTASQFFATGGSYEALVAVRSPAGLVGYAQRRVRVVPTSSLCLVSTASDVDDGGSCTGGAGADGRLSLREAIRYSNGRDDPTAIGFSGLTSVDALAPYQISSRRRSSRHPGSSCAARASRCSPARCSSRAWSSRARGPARRRRRGRAWSWWTAGCTTARPSTRGGGRRCGGCGWSAAPGLPVGRRRRRAGPGPLLEPARLAAGRRAPALPGRARPGGAEHRARRPVRGDRRGGRLRRERAGAPRDLRRERDRPLARGGTGHELRNSVFSRHSTRAVDAGAASFAARDGQLLFDNVDDGGLGGDPGTIAGDPLFLDAASRDYRILADSPARDSAPDLSIDVNGPAPGNYGGPAPDRGAEEGW